MLSMILWGKDKEAPFPSPTPASSARLTSRQGRRASPKLGRGQVVKVRTIIILLKFRETKFILNLQYILIQQMTTATLEFET